LGLFKVLYTIISFIYLVRNTIARKTGIISEKGLLINIFVKKSKILGLMQLPGSDNLTSPVLGQDMGKMY
jgi:hypothetical protein